MINRRLTVAFIVALVVSGIFTYWLSQKSAKTKPVVIPKTQYIAALVDVEAGQAIKAENLRPIDWPASVPLQGGFTRPELLVGRVLLFPATAGQPILEKQLAPPGTGVGITVKIPDGMRAISLRSDEVVGVAGFLQPGTRVDVLVTLHTAANPDPLTAIVLQDAEVLAAGQKTQPDPEGKPTTATVVTILVKPEDAEKVVLASTQGSVHFVLRNNLDNEEFTGKPAELSELSGLPPTPPASSAPAKAVHKQLEVVMTKPPYVVETILGAGKARTDNF